MSMTVGELEAALFEAFPRFDAEPWDQPGLSVGDRMQLVGKVAFNLDQSAEAVIAADEAGCNVLVTHHPPFIKEGPKEFGPNTQAQTTGPGRMIYEAARRGVAVIAMHTNADRAVEVRMLFAQMLGYDCAGNFEHLENPARSAEDTGFGALMETPAGTTLEDVAASCLKAFGGCPRVWGDPDRLVKRIALLNGSWSDPALYSLAVANGIDCLMVGETRYHVGTDAKPYVSFIDMGHDVSELPIVGVLREAVCAAGVPREDTVVLDCSANNWWTPKGEC